MKTNIYKIRVNGETVYAAHIGVAEYYNEETYDFTIADIYKTIDGIVAVYHGHTVPLSMVDIYGMISDNYPNKKRGRRSSSNNKRRAMFDKLKSWQETLPDDLPF